jgi:hypothetical protein
LTSGLLTSIDTPIAIESGIFTGTTILVARGIVKVFRQRAVTADQLEYEISSQIAQTRAGMARALRDREVARTIHDEVLDSLTVITLAGRPLPAETVSRRCHNALKKITRPTHSVEDTSQLDLVNEIAHAVSMFSGRLGIEFNVTGAPDCHTLPVTAIPALIMATLEALRNIERHAGTTHAQITLRCPPDARGELIIEDRGVGFSWQRVPEQKLGISESILGRLADAGIDSKVRSSPGAGTTVAFTWSASFILAKHSTNKTSTERPVKLWNVAVFPNKRRNIVGVYLLPLFFSVILTFVWHFADMRYPTLALLALCAEVALAGACAQAAASLRLSQRASFWLFAMNVISIVAGLLSVRLGVGDGYAFWAAGGGAPCIATISLLRPLRESIPMAAMTIGAIAACLVVFFHSSASSTAGPAGLIMAAAVLGAAHKRAIDRLIVLTDTLIREGRNAMAAQQIARAESEVDSIRLEHVRRAVVPFLRDVAIGKLDSVARPVGQHAFALAQQVRARLIIPQVFRDEPAFAQACDEAMSRGVEVSFNVHRGAVRRINPRVLELLRTAFTDPVVNSVHLSVGNQESKNCGSNVALIKGSPPLDGLAADLARFGVEVDLLERGIMVRLSSIEVAL